MAAMAAKAVQEESLHHATEHLILSTDRKYYRVKIDTSHWQLRSLISSPEQDIVYLPNGTNIISVNTRTRERELVASLTFQPRCLVASKDWICCGGDHGKYTAISLRDRESDADRNLRLSLDNDPTITVPHSTHVARMFNSYRRIRVQETTHNEKIGSEIVNCITIWSPSDGLSERVYKVPVAVVSNNDCTVSILNLATSETLQHLKLPDFVNRTAISPDGELLVSICDDPFLYFHKRVPKSEGKKEQDKDRDSISYEWVLEGRIQLEGQRQADRTQMRGSFALSFSNSGKYLAVATQYGIISVFDAECLADVNSLMVTFTSSRPGRQEGAVRAMEFNPGPFDLLVWTEASGRVGVADVRKLFNSRQLILVTSSQQVTERVTLTDLSSQTPSTSIFRNFRTELMYSRAPLNTDHESRRHRSRFAAELSNRDVEPLTPAELNVLEASSVARQQRDAANAGNEVLAEASATSQQGPWADGRRPTTTDIRIPISRLVSNSGLPTSLRDSTDLPSRRAASFLTSVIERSRRSQLQREAESTQRESNIADVERSLQQARLVAAPNDDTSSSLPLTWLTQAPLADRNPDLFPPITGSGTSSPRISDEQRYRNNERAAEMYANPFYNPSTDVPLRADTGRPLGSRYAADDPQSTDTGRAPESNSISWTTMFDPLPTLVTRPLYPNDPVSQSTRVRVEIGTDDGEPTVGSGPREFGYRLRQPWVPADEEGRVFGGVPNSTRDEDGQLDGVLRASETMGCCWSPDGRILYTATLEGVHEYKVNINGRKMFPSIVMR